MDWVYEKAVLRAEYFGIPVRRSSLKLVKLRFYLDSGLVQDG